MPNKSLSAADFVLCRAEAFDAYVMPTESKREARPPMPAVFSTWKRQAGNGIRVFECEYGLEHGPERRSTLRALQEAHEEGGTAFPADYVYGLWKNLMRPGASSSGKGGVSSFCSYTAII